MEKGAEEMKTKYETMLNPKYDLALAKSYQDLINKTQVMLMTIQAMRKDKLKYKCNDHLHFFYTSNPKLAKKWDMRKMDEEELNEKV